MGKHRSKLQILEKILSVIRNNNGAKKTQIMYQAYLSYKLLIRYLHVVTQSGLIKTENENIYILTKKGENFLAEYAKYNQTLRSVDKTLNLIEDQRSTLEMMCSDIIEPNLTKSS